MTRSGRCLCGAVRWTHDGEVTRNLACHCRDCQKATGSAFTAFIGCRPDDVAWRGEIRHFESTPGTFRGFCPTCGTRLYFRSERWPEEVHIHAATQDNAQAYVPDRHVMMRDSPAWLKLGDDLPRHEGFHAAPKGDGT